MEDAIPRTAEGRLVSIADKLDTLRGCFRVGLIPTSTKDPFALRRAAQGIVRILVEGKLRLPVRELLGGDPQRPKISFLDRVRWLLPRNSRLCLRRSERRAGERMERSSGCGGAPRSHPCGSSNRKLRAGCRRIQAHQKHPQTGGVRIRRVHGGSRASNPGPRRLSRRHISLRAPGLPRWVMQANSNPWPRCGRTSIFSSIKFS